MSLDGGTSESLFRLSGFRHVKRNRCVGADEFPRMDHLRWIHFLLEVCHFVRSKKSGSA